MMNKARLVPTIGLSILLVAGFAVLAQAHPEFARSTGMSCATCHANVAGGPALTDAGKAFHADATKVPAKSVEAADYIGNRKCRICHIAEYKSWMTTPHAASMDTLRLAGHEAVAAMSEKLGVKMEGAASENAACVSCHVTGFELPGGYPAPAEAMKARGADSTRVASLASVSCEACHGPGSKHASAAKELKKSLINTSVGEGDCKGCHTAATSPNFNFDEYKVKGVHAIAKKE